MSRDKYGSNQTERNEKERKKTGVIIGLAITVGVLSASTLGLGIAYGMKNSQAMQYGIELENVYQRNYYDLVDSINNADTKISKILASNNSTYQKKMLTELSENAKDAQGAISTLPISSSDFVENVRFINQLSGYTSTLSEKIAKGGKLDNEDKKSLSNLHISLTKLKNNLNKFSKKMEKGYEIVKESSNNKDINNFTNDFSKIKNVDTDYPTMIYDGPFADSVVNKKVKGVHGEKVSIDKGYDNIKKCFKDISELDYKNDTNGKFSTYNYSLKTMDKQKLYVQVTKQGGDILTVSGHVESNIQNINIERAKKIASDFAKSNGIENVDCVWYVVLNNQAYINLAPKVNNVVLYPDLIKVKVDMENSNVIGYDATSYYTNHVARNLGKASMSISDAQTKIPSEFEVKNKRLVLAPLDYNREVLCYEFECEKEGVTYYFYINAETGEEENILKVLKTNDGSKLM